MNCDRFVNANNLYHTDQDIEYIHLIRKFPHASLHRPSFNSLEMRSYIQVDNIILDSKMQCLDSCQRNGGDGSWNHPFFYYFELFPQKGLPYLKALLFPLVIPHLRPLFLLSQFIIMYLLVCV